MTPSLLFADAYEQGAVQRIAAPRFKNAILI